MASATANRAASRAIALFPMIAGCKSQKLGSSGDTDIQVRVHQSIEIDVCVGCASTLTEEHDMAGSSVKTLVERSYPPGNNFTLSTGETFVMF